MYEDSWYSNLLPRAHKPAEKQKQHRRRESLLKQPNEESQADVARVEGIVETIEEATAKDNSPPQATGARRAKSYSDFYDVVRAHLKKEKELERKKSRENISNELEFTQWYGGIEEELLEASHEEYKLYQDQLYFTRSHLDSIIRDTTSALETLSSLSESFQAVEAQTTAFRKQCENLVEDQNRVTKLSDDIEENLRYYLYLEPITKRLNAPGAGNHVRTKEFADMLSNLDSCLEYMQSHPKHRESESYRAKYRLLLTRALTLIRVHFTNALREVAADVSKRIADRQLNDTTMSVLLYAKFRVGAPDLKRIGLEIKKRAVVSPGVDPNREAEYQSLMNELYQSYSATRGRLMLPIITKRIGEIAQTPSCAKDVVAFARDSIRYIREICLNEYELWGEWFEGEGGLYDFLEAVCEPLYDHLRPRTIHETQILKLCELCSLIQTRYMEEEEEDGSSEIEVPRLDFAALIHPALQDAQTRLVFLSLAVLRDDIEKYKPKPEDLQYPPKDRKTSSGGAQSNTPVLSGKKGSHTPQTPMPKAPMVVDEDDPDSRWNFSAEAAFRGWYPTLMKAIWLLSKIYRLVHSSVFDDLAHRIVHSTTLSLTQASALLSKSASPTDASLFLIKHLLLLKQQIISFDIEFVTPETDIHYDFFGVTNTFWELRSRGGLFNPRTWVGMLMPKVVENMLDAKAEVDAGLRSAINDFTCMFVDRMVGAIDQGKSSAAAKKGVSYKPGEAAGRTAKMREAVEREIPFLRTKVEEYIDDARTREMLVAAVLESVSSRYEDWFDGVYTPSLLQQAKGNGANAGAGAGAGRSGKGKGREDDVWDPDVFSEWAAGVFKVGRLGLGILTEGADGDDDEGGRGGNEDDDDNEDEDGDDGYGSVAASNVGTAGTGNTGTTGIRILM